MSDEIFKPNYAHFTDIVSHSAGRVLENEREKGSTYSYGTFCVIVEHQINSHFGIEPLKCFTMDNEESNRKYFSLEVVNLFEGLGKKLPKDRYKEIYEEVITLMGDYHIDIINSEEYWERWSINQEKQSNLR